MNDGERKVQRHTTATHEKHRESGRGAIRGGGGVVAQVEEEETKGREGRVLERRDGIGDDAKESERLIKG